MSALGELDSSEYRKTSTVRGSQVAKVSDDEGNDTPRGDRGVSFIAKLRKMIFGARDPESDLDMEMLEELHMVTGCEST